MIVIYNDDFLEKLRRPSNVVTIGSFSLDYINPSDIKSDGDDTDSFSREILNIESFTTKYSNEMQGFWESTKKILKLRIDLPESFIEAPNEINIIRFYDISSNLAFLVIMDKSLSSLNSSLSQTRNLFNIPLENTQASIEVVNTNEDFKFLKSYGAVLGDNLYKLDNKGNVVITKESFYKMFSVKDMEDTEFYVKNDNPSLDEFGKKINHNYTYRVYKNLNIFCDGLDSNCEIPTKFDLYRRDGSRLKDDPISDFDFRLTGGIRLYGTADYDEYQVIGDAEGYIGTGTAPIESIPGLVFEEIENTGLSYNINYKKLTFEYKKPEEDDLDMNAAVVLRASLMNPNGGIVNSPTIRFYQGSRTDEWKLISKSTTYFETVDRVDLPVFLFKYNADLAYTEPNNRKPVASRIHKFSISTTLKIEKPEDIIITFENNRLNDYFDVKCTLSKVYDDLDDTIVKRTTINVKLYAKQRNNGDSKWWPLNEKGESTLYKATVGYDKYSTDFYMVQSPKVKGLGLYEFNPVGAYFSPIQSIEFSPIEESKVYWMLADEKVIPEAQPWWRSSYIEYPLDPAIKGELNASLGITVQGIEYLGKDTFKTNKQSEIKKYPESPKLLGYGFGKFSETSEFALRPDIETTANASSFLTVQDEELFSGNKYLAIFDEFSLDNQGYITLGNSKIVSNDGLVQYDGSGNTITNINTSTENGIRPIIKDNTTYLSTNFSENTTNNSANLSSTKSHYTDSNRMPSKISTATTTDGRLVDTEVLGPKASQYWITDASVIGQYTSDLKTSNSSDIVSTVNSASIAQSSVNEVVTDKQDSVLAYISKQGIISYTSKEEGIAVKVITDSDGTLIRDPRNIWDNRKLRPVVITFKKAPIDVNSIEGDPITFYRVSEDEITMDYKEKTWRNMVTRAQVTYEVMKKGQEPFIQIISGTKEPDVVSLKLVDGKLVEYIERKSTQKIETTYINREPITVRSNCPFRLNFKYSSGFENTLAFDDVTKIMKSYRITNSQVLNSNIYDSTYGQDIYFNILEADLTGEIGSIVATYRDFTTSSKIISNSFTGYDTAKLVKVDGTIDNDALNRIVFIDKGLAKNIYASSRRTLHNTFRSFAPVKEITDYTDYDDYGDGTSESAGFFDTKDSVREAITGTKSLNGLVISAPTPFFDEEGYVSHKVTLDISNSQDSPKRYPISSLGKLSIYPFNSKRSYTPNSSNAEHLYLYESGLMPKISIKSYPGMLGGIVDNSEGSSSIERPYTAASISGKVYSFSAWVPDELQLRLIKGVASSDEVLFAPVRWENTQTNKAYYTLPGAEVTVEEGNYTPIYTGAKTPDLDNSLLFECFENPVLWSKVDMSKVSASTVNGVKTLTSESSNIYLDETYMATTGSYVTKSSRLYKVGVKNEVWEVDPDSDITEETADMVTTLITGLSENTLMVDNGTTVYIKSAIAGKSKVYVRTRKDITLGNGTTVEYPHTTTNALKNCIVGYGNLKLITLRKILGKSLQAKQEVKKYFIDAKGNYYIENTKTLGYPFVYKNTDLILSNIRYAAKDDNTLLDSRTTFIIESNYRLQYVHLDQDEDTEETIVIDTPTKVFPLGQLPQDDPEGENCLNVLYEKIIPGFYRYKPREERAKAYSRALDIDIHVLPKYIGSGSERQPLFKIESITENPLTTGKYEYTIVLAPKHEYIEDGKRYCGKVIINSRVRKVINDTTNVPKELLDAYPVVLPLYEDGLQVPGKTRPSSDLNYELNTLYSMQSKIDEIVPPAELTVEIYQQKLNYIQLIGDRAREVRNGETRKFSTMYQPNLEYYKAETDDVILLNSDTIQLFGKNTGWSSMNKSTKKYIAELYDFDTLLYHLPAKVGTYLAITRPDGQKIYSIITPGDIYCVENISSNKTKYYSVAIPKTIISGSVPVPVWVPVNGNTTWEEDGPTASELCLGKVTITKDVDIDSLLSPLLALKPGDIYKISKSTTDMDTEDEQVNEFFEYMPSDIMNKVTINSNNYNPNTTNKTGLPYTLVSFNNIFSSYYPSRINSENIQNGSILSEYKNGSTRDYLINFNIDLGYWIDKGSDPELIVETRDYFKKSDDQNDKIIIDGVTYIRWYKYEKNKTDDVKLELYNLLLPENIDTEEGANVLGSIVCLIKKDDPGEIREVNGISLEKPLPEKYYFTEMKNGDTDDNYFTVNREKFLVEYDKDSEKLYGTSNSGGYRYTWQPVEPNFYQECVSFIQPGVNFGLVCATPTNEAKLYLSDNSDKNTITETVGSTSTYLDFMAGTFKLTSESMSYDTIDMEDRFVKEGTMLMNSITVANRNEYFQKRYKQTSEVIQEINGIRYTVWDRYVIGEDGRYTLDSTYSYLVNKRYDSPVTIGDISYGSSLERLDINNPDPNFRYLYPDYVINSNDEIIEDNINKPFVDYEIVGEGIPRLYVSGDIEYDRWVKYELTDEGKYVKYPGYEVLMHKDTDYRAISLKNPKHADYTVRSDGDYKENYFNDRGEVFVKYEFSHGDYIERTNETMGIEGSLFSYEVWAKYEYDTNTNRYELQDNYKYLFPQTSDGLPIRNIDGLYEPAFVVVYDGDGNIDQRYPTDKRYDEMIEVDGKIRIYEEGASREEYLYKTGDSSYVAKGTTELSITCIDNVTKDKEWNYEILNESASIDFDKNYLNNIRINFPQNTTENDIIRIFRIDSKSDVGGVIHSVTLKVKQNGFLGNIYCDSSINFTSYGKYVGNYVQVDDDRKQVDHYFYFDTDVPISELEFRINDENASAILSKGDNTDSYYGPDFKRYRLSIELSNNLTRAKKYLSLEIIRNYSVYKNNTVSRKFKTLKKVNIVQGYRALYIESPYYNQKKLNSDRVSIHTELLRTLNPGGTIATKDNPLIVPFSQSIMFDDITGMNYTIPLHYVIFEPTIEDGFKNELKKEYSREELIDMFNSLPSDWLTFDWKIEYPTNSNPEILFESHNITCVSDIEEPFRWKVDKTVNKDNARYTVINSISELSKAELENLHIGETIWIKSENTGYVLIGILNTPFLYMEYNVKDEYLTTGIRSYLTIIMTLSDGTSYEFYVNMKKSTK